MGVGRCCEIWVSKPPPAFVIVSNGAIITSRVFRVPGGGRMNTVTVTLLNNSRGNKRATFWERTATDSRVLSLLACVRSLACRFEINYRNGLEQGRVFAFFHLPCAVCSSNWEKIYHRARRRNFSARREIHFGANLFHTNTNSGLCEFCLTRLA